MRKMMAFGLAVALVSSFALAQNATKPADTTKATETKSEASAKASTTKHHAAAKVAMGEVVSSSAGSLVVKESVKKGGKELTFTTNDQTKYGKGKKAEDLKAGDMVTVRYAKEGETLVAKSVSEHTAKASGHAHKGAASETKTQSQPSETKSEAPAPAAK